jgi:precorrin-2/cobalt-factor-2 C20-methyltransferase
MKGRTKNMSGKLYGVGVGPGDPELITIKAIRILEQVDYIAVPKTSNNRESTALSIVKGILDKDKEIVELLFPMSFDEELLEESWNIAIKKVRDCLNRDKSIAFITLGDPTVYSTYMYIHQKLSKEGYIAEIIPGITSFCASSARVGISLGENRECIAIVPSAYECENLDNILDSFENIVLMKVSGKLVQLKMKLEEKGLADKTVLVSRCGFDDEMIEYDLGNAVQSKLSYFTTMIIKKNGVR